VSFSPNGRWLAAYGTPWIVDVQTGAVRDVTGFSISGWTPSGELVLARPDQTSALWHPDGTTTDTGLPAGAPAYGPLPGEVALITRGSGSGISGTAAVHIGNRTANVPLLAAGGAWNVSWAPDGSSCFVLTGSDDAQAMRDSLIRVAAP
jgi:hypothetical protein